MEDANILNFDPVDFTWAAFFLPPLIAFINQKPWRKEYRGLAFVVVCLAYSTVVVILREETDWNQWRNVVIQVFAVTAAMYSWFWGPTRLGPLIEAKTSYTAKTPQEQANVADGALYEPTPTK